MASNDSAVFEQADRPGNLLNALLMSLNFSQGINKSLLLTPNAEQALEGVVD
ncbi:MAG: hypothetical protein AAF387_07165 [Pseudomonadota bacterium]